MEQKNYHFEEIRGSLLFSESKVEIDCLGDEIIEGTFGIEEQDGLDVEGYVYSSNFRMQVINPVLQGAECQVEYRFDSRGMNMGDAVKGNFYIVRNRGEFSLPFVALKQREVLDSSLGPIKNLFHFTNLAKSNWEEAVAVFANPMF